MKSSGWLVLFSLSLAMSCLAPSVRADTIYLNATGPESTTFGPGTYDSTLSYDTTEAATSTTANTATYDATLTFNPGGTPVAGTLNITLNTLDPSLNVASEIEFDDSGTVPPGFSFNDTLDIYAPPGTFSLNLPTLSDLQNLIAANTYQASAFGSVFILGYDAAPLTLSVTNTSAAAVPSPAAAAGALPLLGALVAWRIKRRQGNGEFQGSR